MFEYGDITPIFDDEPLGLSRNYVVGYVKTFAYIRDYKGRPEILFYNSWLPQFVALVMPWRDKLANGYEDPEDPF